MYTTTEVAAISDMQERPAEIMARLINGPVILTEHGRSAAVLLSMEEWQAINEQLRSLQEAQFLRSLYAEFDAEERMLAETGLGHYAETLKKEENDV